MIGRLCTPHRLLRRLIADREGATIIEFALVAPVLFLMIFGIFDMAHTQYSNAILRGAIQTAGRELSLQSAGNSVRQEAVDARVREQIAILMPPGAEYRFQRLSHFDFSDIGEPEEFTDQNADAICNNNEPYIDINDNNRWDRDRGSDGLGGARDAVLYTASVTYPRLFPMFTLAGLPRNITLEASTVLRNQPFARQNTRTVTPRNCT